MYQYTYCLDGVIHEIVSQEPIPSAIDGNIIPISASQNQIAKQLKELLREWIRIAEDNNIAWFCNGGTLLGAIRDKGLIHYDNDLDLVVFLRDFHKIKNIKCGEKYEISHVEGGFQLHYKGHMFPFIDLWVNTPNPNDPSKIIMASPVLYDGSPTYIAQMIWSNDYYDVADVSLCDSVPFEDVMINVPKNSGMYLRKMYGDDCLTRYVIQTHTDDHYTADLLPHPIIRSIMFTTLNNIERHHTVISRSVNLFATLIANQVTTSDRNKTKRHLDIIARHIGERYFNVPPPFGV